MTFSSLADGRITAAVPDRMHMPRVWKSKPPVLFMTGGGETATTGYGSAAFIVDAIVNAGYRVVMPSVPWLCGNATADARILAAVNFSRSQLGCSNDPPIIVGVSNGIGCGMLYAVDHPVLAMVGILPPIDVDYVYENNVEGVRPFIATAWGITYPTPLPTEANEYAHAATLASIPMQLWYSSNDEISHNIASFGAITGAELHNVGPHGHTNAGVTAVDASAVVNFINSIV